MLGTPGALRSQPAFWQSAGSPISGGEITAITADNSGVLVAASREGSSMWEGVLYRSTDKGKNWAKTGQSFGITEFKVLATHPDGTMFAGSTGGVAGAGYRSTDGGSTWSTVLFSDPLSRVERTYSCFAFGQAGEVYAGYWERGGTYKGGVMKSTDVGKTWVQVFTGNAYDDVVAVAADSPGYVYVGLTMGGIRRSTNGGATWTARPGPGGSLSSLVIADSGHVLAGVASGMVLRSTNRCSTWAITNVSTIATALLVNKTTRTIYGGGLQFGRSTDDGRTWTMIDPQAGWISSICQSPDGELFAGTNGIGVARSSDNGDHWGHLGIVTIVAKTLATGPGTAMLALAASGTFMTTDRGIQWRSCGKPYSDIRSAAFSPRGWIYLGTWGGGVLRSTDGGGSWTPSNSGLPNLEVNVIAVHSDGRIVAGTNKGICLSTNNGDSWSRIGPDSAAISGLAWGNGETLFATGFGRCYRSLDGGGTWTSMANSRIVYARGLVTSANGHLFCWTSDNLFSCSTNGGTTWIPRDPAGSPTQQVAAVNATGDVFLGTSNGCLRSTDEGITWTAVNGGLLDTDVSALAIDSAGVLYASTGRGIYRSSPPTLAVALPGGTAPALIALQQNYPNPFNPNSDIRYQISEFRMVKLAVYDIRGREVAVLVNETKPPGAYQVRFDGTGLASGVYFYRLNAGSSVETRKMLLVR
jgi:hypothetical protein